MKYQEDTSNCYVTNSRIAVVYFLIDHDREVVYVGQTTNLLARSFLREYSWCRAYWFYVPRERCGEIEKYYIRKYKPKYNKGSLYDSLGVAILPDKEPPCWDIDTSIVDKSLV